MVEMTGGLSDKAKLRAQLKLANWTGETDSEDDGQDDGSDGREDGDDKEHEGGDQEHEGGDN